MELFEYYIILKDLNPLQKQITNQDLMGFWDLVQIQVDDLKKAFTKIEQLRMNGWQCPAKVNLILFKLLMIISLILFVFC